MLTSMFALQQGDGVKTVSVGDNTFTLKTRDPDMNEQTFTVVIRRLSGVSTLKGLNWGESQVATCAYVWLLAIDNQ